MNVRHALISVIGVVASQGANFLSVILIGRLCGPDVLGDFSHLTAIGFFVGSVIGLRMETACMASDRRSAVNAAASSGAVAFAIAVVLAVAASVGGQWQLMPAIALAGGVFCQQALSFAMATDRAYTQIALAKAIPNTAFVAFAVLWMLTPAGECGATRVAGVYGAIFLVSTLLPLAFYLYRAMPLQDGALTTLSPRQVRYARYLMPSTLLNSVAIYSTAILMPIIFNSTDAGIFALAYRIGYFTASLLSQSLGNVFRRDLMDDSARKPGLWRNPAVSFSLLLAVVSTVLVLTSYVGLRVIIDFQLGKDWDLSKTVYLLLVPYFVLMAIFGSVAQVFIVFDRQRVDVLLQAASAAVIFAVFGSVWVLHIEFIQAVTLLSVAGSALACVGIWLAIRVTWEQQARQACVSSGFRG